MRGKVLAGAAYAAVIAAYALAIACLPVLAYPHAVNDDALFVRLAQSVAEGKWLGAYDHTTLSKGPIYAFWIAFSHATGAPILGLQALAYALACLTLVLALRPWLKRLTPVVFVLLLANPAVYSLGELRVVREGLYMPLTVLIVALMAWWARLGAAPPAKRAALAGSLGVVLAAFWCTREEGLWIAPALGAGGLAMAASRLAEKSRATLLRQDAVMVLGCLGAAFAGVTAIGVNNLRHYGVADIVEFKQREFLAAYGALSRIKTETNTPYVAVPRAALAQAYTVSPTAAALRPLLDSPAMDGTIQVGCAFYAVAPCDGELRSAWFMWMLREAVAAGGFYDNARHARRYYRQLAREINAACNAGKLTCGPARATMAPPVRPDFPARTGAALMRVVRYFQTLPDLVTPTAGLRDCAVDDCSKDAQLRLFLATAHQPVFVTNDDPSVLVAARAPGAEALARERRAVAVGNALQAMMVVFRAHLTWMMTAAAAAFALAVLMMGITRRPEALTLTAALAAIVVLSRAALLAYLDAVAMPAIQSLYLSPAFPFLLLFVALAPIGLMRTLIGVRRRAAPSPKTAA